MQNLDIKGLFVEEDFLLNYKKYNLSLGEAFFILQLSYVSNHGRKVFNAKKFAEALQINEENLYGNLSALYTKKVIYITEQGYLVFSIDSADARYYTLKELLALAEKVINRMLSAKETDIVASWFEKKFSKEQIDEAFRISDNIHYVNGILNNKMEKISNDDNNEDDVLNYDWLDY
ncbi:MAG: DnaD domain protein [Gemella sp.]|nr:DnaD domain protein [Gemella sp.]